MGDFVHLQVPQVDRAPLGSPTLALLVIEHNDTTGMSRLATKHGVLDVMVGAEQILKKGVNNTYEEAGEICLLWLDGKLEKKSFRQLVTAGCPFGGQGKTKCTCKKGCQDSRCACRQAGYKCNSSCTCNRLGNCTNLS